MAKILASDYNNIVEESKSIGISAGPVSTGITGTVSTGDSAEAATVQRLINDLSGLRSNLYLRHSDYWSSWTAPSTTAGDKITKDDLNALDTLIDNLDNMCAQLHFSHTAAYSYYTGNDHTRYTGNDHTYYSDSTRYSYSRYTYVAASGNSNLTCNVGYTHTATPVYTISNSQSTYGYGSANTNFTTRSAGCGQTVGNRLQYGFSIREQISRTSFSQTVRCSERYSGQSNFSPACYVRATLYANSVDNPVTTRRTVASRETARRVDVARVQNIDFSVKSADTSTWVSNTNTRT